MSDAETSTVATEQGAEDKAKNTRKQIIEWVVVIAAALLTATILRASVVQAFSIPSVSMEKTLLVGDRVLVNKLNKKAHRGDVVVFERPPGEQTAQIKDLIKRVVGLPGDKVSARSGLLFINDKLFPEPYLVPGTNTIMEGEVNVPKGFVFVMGDNRGSSRDSRFFGPIKQSTIIGHAYVRVWPPGRFGSI